MPLSEFEKRELGRISEQLQQEDPGLSSLLDGDALRRGDRTRIHRGLSFLAVGLFLMVAGQMLQVSTLGVFGFSLVCIGAFRTVKNVQNMLERRS